MVTRLPHPKVTNWDGLNVLDVDPIKHVTLDPRPSHVDWQDYAQFISTADMKRIVLYLDTLKELTDIPGDIVEIGIYRGGNLKLLATAYACVEPDGRRNVIGFDTFDGFPKDQLSLPQEKAKTDIYSTEGNLMAAVAKLSALKRPARLVVGDVVQTFKSFYDKWQNHIALAYLDVDLEAPSVAALDVLAERVAVGGRIFLDQYCRDGWSETAAVDRLLSKHPGLFKLVRLADQTAPTAYLEKLKELSP